MSAVEIGPHRAWRNPVSVNGTSTSLVVVDVRDLRSVAVTFKNTDVSQTVDLYIWTKSHKLDDLAPRQQPPEFAAIPPGETRTRDVELGTEVELEVVGVASGAGCDGSLSIVAGSRR